MTHFPQAVCDSRKRPANHFARLRQGAKNQQALVRDRSNHNFAPGLFVRARLARSLPADPHSRDREAQARDREFTRR